MNKPYKHTKLCTDCFRPLDFDWNYMGFPSAHCENEGCNTIYTYPIGFMLYTIEMIKEAEASQAVKDLIANN